MAVAAAFPQVRRLAQAVNECDADSLPRQSGTRGIAVAPCARTGLRATRPPHPPEAAR
ncbi:hypothetical protein Spla01_06112 [Streptomyces platensis]|uniref:Uncharacterized protein n=1 Tax=Streptomyces platensis TaxID=58346 RepID=A0ABX3XML8_STRPT|nr:hypothetical protein BG653_06845 [Streptomyces platensis]